MMKTLDDYMKLPELDGQPSAMKEIHAIRLQIYDERKGMTTAEYNKAASEGAAAFLARHPSKPVSGASL